MKEFNNLQELWSYCLFCPLCQDMTRTITLIPIWGGDILKHQKKGRILSVRGAANIGLQRYEMTYDIDCVSNTFTVKQTKAVPNNNKISTNTGLEFYIMTVCDKCNNTSANTKPIDLNLASKKSNNFSMEIEGVYLLEGKYKYHLGFNHVNNLMFISKCFVDDDGGIVDDNKVLNLPLINFDFRDVKKVVDRIRTLIVFS